MADIFASPKGMLGQGKKHLTDLEAQINAFTREQPWTTVVERDNDRTQVIKIKFSKRLPDNLGHIVFDCANNLRSVLDQIAFAIGVKHTGTSKPKSAKFPFGPTEGDMLNNKAGGCKDLPAEISEFFAAFKPYKGGNNALWALNELCNAPKHMTIYPVAVQGMGMQTFGNLSVKGRLQLALNPKWDSEKNEIVFARLSPDAQVNGNFQFAFGVALGEVDEIMRGQHPISVLSAMAREVERVLLGTEAECRRIDLIA